MARSARPVRFPGIAGRAVPWWSLIVVLAAAAFFVRLSIMTNGGGLLTVGAYDDGVYFAAADALIHGRIPYRDFLFLQPPGVVLAGTPFAWLGTMTTDAVGFAACRVGFMVVGAANTVLVAVVLRRTGYLAAAVGGAFYAVTYVAAYSERSILLETFGTTGVLVALAIIVRPWLRSRMGWSLVAGVALGVACGFKIWYVVPAAIIVAFAGRSWWRVFIGGVAGTVIVCLPFFVVAPRRMFRQVVLDQIGRGQSDVAFMQRVRVLVGNFSIPEPDPAIGLTTDHIVGALVVAAVVACAIAVTVRGGRLFVALFAADAGILLFSPSFYPHYGALTMPMLALVVGVAVGRIAALFRWRAVRAAVAATMIGAVIFANLPLITRGFGIPVPMVGLEDAAARVDGCIMTDDPTILPAMNVLSRNLAAGCPLEPDLTGWIYASDRHTVDGKTVGRSLNPKWQARAVRYLTSGSAYIIVWPRGFSPASKAVLTDAPLLFEDGPWKLYENPAAG